MLTMCYLGPSSLLQVELASASIKKLLSYLFLVLWYADMILQVVMAFNRFMTVVFYQYPIFTRPRCWVIGIFVYGFCFVLAYFSDYVIPCCTAYLHYAVFSYEYIEKGTNYTNMYVELPLNASSSLICSILYTWIFVYVHKNSQINKTEAITNTKARRRKEVRYAVQFAGCSLLSFLTWVTFRIFPLIISPSVPQLYSFTVQSRVAATAKNSRV
uniref:7TM_GPCR_Srx domain-containing protein n=1 Tax=Panagrellus redivivus TaxID=6233 RepID=A0A7E4ZW48_PANRE